MCWQGSSGGIGVVEEEKEVRVVVFVELRDRGGVAVRR